jgi:hypothetical protein
MKACMGGFCGLRESCRHYTTDDRRDPAERLCEPGQDGEAIEVRRFKPIGSWEGQPIKRAALFPEVA